jgi:hypothetical protein
LLFFPYIVHPRKNTVGRYLSKIFILLKRYYLVEFCTIENYLPMMDGSTWRNFDQFRRENINYQRDI